MMKHTTTTALLSLLLATSAIACDDAQGSDESSLTGEEQAHLDNFDDLDFNVFTGQEWDKLSHSHGEDVIVHWPDGRVTEGIAPHIDDLKWLFAFAPDTRISEHPIKIASGDWTTVTGVMEGTFTRAMPTANGDVAPTNQAFRLEMATIGRWEDGVMVEEWLFWDNQTFNRQLGLTE